MRKLLLVAGAMLALTAGSAQATVAKDAANDFLTVDHSADLDILSFEVTFDQIANAFTFDADFAGAIDPTKTGSYVIGINTGAGAKTFANVPGIRFDQTIGIQKTGLATLGRAAVDLPGAPFAIPNATISGDNLHLVLQVDDKLKSTGFSTDNFRFSFWSRGTAGNTDFAPDNSTFSATPEPAAWAMMIAGFGFAGGVLRRRRVAAQVFG
jgi:hypothetical protein